MVGLTYLLILEPIERFRSGHLHGHHAICGPPTLLQSTILLSSYSALYPEVGGLSGRVSREFPREVLKWWSMQRLMLFCERREYNFNSQSGILSELYF